VSYFYKFYDILNIYYLNTKYMWESYEIKYRMIWERLWEKSIFQTYEELTNSIKSIIGWYWRLNELSIKWFDDFEEYIILKRNYDEYSEWRYYIFTESWDKINIDEIYSDISKDYEDPSELFFQAKEKDITYKISEELWFKSNKIWNVKFKDWNIIINWDNFISNNKKFINSKSRDFMIIVYYYFSKNNNIKEVQISDLYSFLKDNKNCINKYLKSDISSKDIEKENIRKTYIPTINKNILKLYPNQQILDIKWYLIKANAI